MRYWLTTHYPHYPQSEYPADLDLWSIFVPRPFAEDFNSIRKGDRVAIYIVGSGPTVAGKSSRPKGEQAIRCLTEVAGERVSCPLREEYTNGKIGHYSERVPCKNPRFGNLGRQSLCRIIGWKENFALRGIGRGSGLRELDASEFEEIDRQFQRR